jgi:SNF2 family DNA or RNA helicase
MLHRKDLHPYQNRAVDFVLSKRKCALFLFLGAGKSVISLTAVKDLIDACIVNRVLIVAPLRVANSTWKQEARAWDHLKDLKISVCTGAAQKRKAALNAKANVFVINKENLSWLVDICSKKGAWPFQMIVIDESTCAKNHSTKIFRSLKKVAKHSKYVVLLSGTPSPNSLHDLYSQMFLIDDGKALGKTVTSFRKQFCEVDYWGHTYSVKDGYGEKIKARIKPLVLSMIGKEYLELPARININENVILEPKVMKQYKDFEKKLFMEIDDEEVEALSAAVLANKLLQFTSGAIYVDEDHNWKELHTAKLDALAEIIEENPEENVLLAYGYKHSLTRIRKRFPSGIMLDKKGDALKRWNNGEIKLLLIHPQSASHGINAQYGGSLLVWYDLTWSLEKYAQTCGRLHRQGQERPVRVVHLVAEGTIDNRVLGVLRNKDAVQADLLRALRG